MDKPNPSLDCPTCGYSLTGLTQPSCPECGQTVAIITTQELKRSRRWLKPFIGGALSLPALYLAFYVFLRVSGIYPSDYSQGNWGVTLDSNSEVVDALYSPLTYFEAEVQFHFSWFHDDPLSC
ncbi:MAG: hypothetical protein AAGI37_10145 [Planctomycetota bacterium]